jgi:dTMP kinase
MKKNLFIAFEGIDGSGKSTQVKLLTERLRSTGKKVYETFEPTDSPIGSLIRNIFNHRLEADHLTIAGLFVADRLDHLLNRTNGVLKKLDEGFTVITDRYYFSSYAYHSVHMSMDWVIAANSKAAELLRPDLTVYIDMDPEISIQRLRKGRNLIELYETVDNLKAVKAKYEEAFQKLSSEEKVFKIDGNNSVDEISDLIWQEICHRWK